MPFELFKTLIAVCGKKILEVIEEKWLRWFGHVKRMPGNRLPLKIFEWKPEGMRRGKSQFVQQCSLGILPAEPSNRKLVGTGQRK
jgi:hypothetical protein